MLVSAPARRTITADVVRKKKSTEKDQKQRKFQELTSSYPSPPYRQHPLRIDPHSNFPKVPVAHPRVQRMPSPSANHTATAPRPASRTETRIGASVNEVTARRSIEH
ncbi:hypothetical protein K523DRAFT_143983 [Schizophyllum commune Tattone D]|nr:hypothetical protein K523DRAFT_143983 [Schizophyllum commune Tattone D]